VLFRRDVPLSRWVIKNPDAVTHGDDRQRLELRAVMDAYIDERIELKLKEHGLRKK